MRTGLASALAAGWLGAVLITACSGKANEARAPATVSRGGGAVGNIYAGTGAGALSEVAKRARPLVYVPNSKSASVTVIDPRTYSVIRTFATGKLPQHVVPAYDLATLWVANNDGNTLTPIDPLTGQEGKQVPVSDPYNMYFTPDGKLAIIVAERRHQLDFRDPHTMKMVEAVPINCSGIDHMEFTNDGRFVIATCEFSGQLVKVDLATRKPVAYLSLLPKGKEGFAQRVRRFFRLSKRKPLSPSMPQDIRSSPDGKVFFVADMRMNGVHLIDPHTFSVLGFIKTGVGTHGLYPSRDGKDLYVTNRGWNTTAGGRHGPGSISVIDFAGRRVVANWPVPGGGSPDMGNVTANGRELWISGRYDDEVYVFDTQTGKMTHRIPVGREPHGLCVWPQPGVYSLGHTGNMR